MKRTIEGVTVITDGKQKQFKYWSEVPAAVRQGQFDHLSEEDASDGFFRYRGVWYHLSDFMGTRDNPPAALKGWHGYHSDSYFSGVLIAISGDCESYKVGRYYS